MNVMDGCEEIVRRYVLFAKRKTHWNEYARDSGAANKAIQSCTGHA